MRSIPLLALAALLFLVACKPNPDNRELRFMPDMYENPAVKAQEEYAFFRNANSNLVPPTGTVPRNFEVYPYTPAEAEKANAELMNPLPATPEVLEMGRKYYAINCKICHGVSGAGDGLATIAHRPNGMPVPPQLYSEKIRKEWKDGHLYHIISVGQGNMPGYKARIDPTVRWAIVHYVRALGAAATPGEDDLKAVEKQELKPADIEARDRNFARKSSMLPEKPAN